MFVREIPFLLLETQRKCCYNKKLMDGEILKDFPSTDVIAPRVYPETRFG